MLTLLKSRIFQSIVGVAISVILLLAVFFRTNWDEVMQHISGMHFWWFFPITVVMILHYYIRAWRWRLLLPESDNAGIQRHFDCIMVGNFATFILPLRAGEFIRPFLLTRYSPSLSFSSSFASIVIERFFDLAVVLLSFGLVAARVESIPKEVTHGVAFFSLLAALLLAVMLLGLYWPARVTGLAKRCFTWFPDKFKENALGFIADFLAGGAVLRRDGRLFKVVGLSFLVWTSCYIIFYLFFKLFGADPALWPVVAVAVCVALSVAAPSAPGFIGIYETGCVIGFALFGLGSELAKAYAIVSHVYQYLLFVVYGMYVLARDGVSLTELRR